MFIDFTDEQKALREELQGYYANLITPEIHELQKLEEAKEGVTVIKVKYSDTDAMFDKQVKNALREFGIPEDVIHQQNFKYG